ncbi:hypothetical protein A3709_20075 [Halioglobus sp. HI00S01]|nr:hypothetical protein A3709_20075 [Halioglobus sp. HI00S01]
MLPDVEEQLPVINSWKQGELLTLRSKGTEVPGVVARGGKRAIRLMIWSTGEGFKFVDAQSANCTAASSALVAASDDWDVCRYARVSLVKNTFTLAYQGRPAVCAHAGSHGRFSLTPLRAGTAEQFASTAQKWGDSAGVPHRQIERFVHYLAFARNLGVTIPDFANVYSD